MRVEAKKITFAEYIKLREEQWRKRAEFFSEQDDPTMEHAAIMAEGLAQVVNHTGQPVYVQLYEGITGHGDDGDVVYEGVVGSLVFVVPLNKPEVLQAVLDAIAPHMPEGWEVPSVPDSLETAMMEQAMSSGRGAEA